MATGAKMRVDAGQRRAAGRAHHVRMNELSGPSRAAPLPAPGLSRAQAEARLRADGPNELPQSDARRWPQLLAAVLREPMVLLLFAASAVYLLLGEPGEAALLLVSVVLVAALSAYQEFRSERALQALRDLSSPRARLWRDGAACIVPAREVVVGDLLLLEEGDRVPADAVLLEDGDLVVDESLLTGESVPVHRAAAGADFDAAIHASTLVVRGQGKARVTATGARTEVGRIGTSLRSLRSERSPLQKEMRRVVALFATLATASSAAVVALHVARYGDWLPALLAGITLAVANIPEEFPIVLAVFLALGAWRMARHQALVRRAPAIEALGSISVLCVDKTGTLTENRMALAELVAPSARGAPSPESPAALRELLRIADLATSDQAFDPTERAIREAAGVAGLAPRQGRIHVYPFSAQLLAMAQVWSTPVPGVFEVACKGAPEAVLDLCELSPAAHAAYAAEAAQLAARGLRVLAVASARWQGEDSTLPLTPKGFAFAWSGLVALADPLRAGVKEAVAEARAAGVRVVMLTGDHPATARSIAAAAGLHTAQVLTGEDLARLDDAALAQAVAQADVFARVRPDVKLRLVQAFKRAGAVVAMTGDGVNDAPALVAAHVGIAMGARGTDVAREAASIVLLDDNFVTIVRALRQGRVIYDNLAHAVRYVLAVHVPITGLALLPLLLGTPLILMPVHVVFLEMIIDPASTLVFEGEPARDDVMRRPPRPSAQPLVSARMLFSSLAQGAVVFLAVAAVYLFGRRLDVPAPELGALAFIATVVGNLGLIAANLSLRPSAGSENRRVLWIIVGAALAGLAATTLLATPAAWLGFSPPPLRLAALALVLPLAAVAGELLLRRFLPRSFAG
jgi:Ca2+-transporting ATPase